MTSKQLLGLETGFKVRRHKWRAVDWEKMDARVGNKNSGQILGKRD